MLTAAKIMCDIALAYCFCVLTVSVVHNYIRKEISKRILLMSHTSCLSIGIALGCAALRLYAPMINGHCMCAFWHISAICWYILGMFLLKGMYVERIAIFNNSHLQS